MNDIKNLNRLFEVFKPSDNVLNKDDRFIKPKDNVGWTNGYLADLTDLNTSIMEAKAIVKGLTICEGDNAPEIKKVIPNTAEHIVESVEFDLATKSVELKNSKIKSYCNPKFLGYFQKVFENLGGIQKITLTGELTAIKIYVGDMLVGVVMPIRNDR